LENIRPKVAKYSELIAKRDDLYKGNKTHFDELKKLKNAKYELNLKAKKISEKLTSLYANNQANSTVINNLIAQKDNLRLENTKLWDEIRALEYEWDDKWKKHDDQQKLVDYIKEAQKKIALLKKNQEKYEKRKKKEEEENAKYQNSEVVVTKKEEDINAYEINTCEWLTKYFANLIHDKSKDTTSKPEVVHTTSSKIDEDIQKGIIKPVKKDDGKDDIFGLSTVSPTKKKTKGPKISKREQKIESSNVISLDINVITKIKDIGLIPPALKSEIKPFLDSLEKVHGVFKKEALNKKNKTQSRHEEHHVQETPKETLKEHVKEVIIEKVEEVVHKEEKKKNMSLFMRKFM